MFNYLLTMNKIKKIKKKKQTNTTTFVLANLWRAAVRNGAARFHSFCRWNTARTSTARKHFPIGFDAMVAVAVIDAEKHRLAGRYFSP